MYNAKYVCDEIGMNYETLKFYCKEGLVPNVQRDKNNYRMFDQRNIEWIKSLMCLRKCGMGIDDMKKYMNYCLEGPASIDQRKKMLAKTREDLVLRLDEINESIKYIDDKQDFFNDILSGKIKYTSNLIDVEKDSL